MYYKRYRHPGALDLGGLLSALVSMIPVGSNFFDRRKTLEELQEKYGSVYTSKRFSRDIYELKRSGYIVLAKQKGQTSIQFTAKASLKVIEQKAKLAKSDNTPRFVSFDIPEDLINCRDAFRRAIKRVGFVQIQRSLWVYDKDVSEYIELLMKEYNIEKYVVYIVSNSTNIDPTIKALIKGQTKIKFNYI